MSHIRNYDIRLMTLLAAMVGSIAPDVGPGAEFSRFGGGRGGRRGGRDKGNPIALIVLVLWLFYAHSGADHSRSCPMAVSRKREYLADATGAQFTRNPLALATALEKLSAASAATRSITRGAAHPVPWSTRRREPLLPRGLSGRRDGLPPAHPPADHPARGDGLPAERSGEAAVG